MRARRIASTMGKTPRTGRTSPLSESSPTAPIPSSTSPATASAAGRSRPLPSIAVPPASQTTSTRAGDHLARVRERCLDAYASLALGSLREALEDERGQRRPGPIRRDDDDAALDAAQGAARDHRTPAFLG